MSKECLTYIQAKQKLGFGGELAINPNELVTCYQCEVMGADVRLLEKYHIKQDCPADDDIEPGAVKIFGPYSVRIDNYEFRPYDIPVFNPSKGFKISFKLTSYIPTNNVAGIIWAIMNVGNINSVITIICYAGAIGIGYPGSSDFITYLPNEDSAVFEITYTPGNSTLELLVNDTLKNINVTFPNTNCTRLNFGNDGGTLEGFLYQLDNFTIWNPYVP